MDYVGLYLRAWTRKTATGAKTYYYYDQGNAVLETKADGTMVGMNIFAPDGLVTRWSKLSGSIPVVGDYQFDWQGNAVHCLFSGARYADEPLIHSAYNAWGQRNFVYSNGASSASDLLRFGYNARWGYKLDTETGLYYCQQRYYDPANGRWITRDPISFAGGANVYGYCSGGPVGQSDSSGLTPPAFFRDPNFNPFVRNVARDCAVARMLLSEIETHLDKVNRRIQGGDPGGKAFGPEPGQITKPGGHGPGSVKYDGAMRRNQQLRDFIDRWCPPESPQPVPCSEPVVAPGPDEESDGSSAVRTAGAAAGAAAACWVLYEGVKWGAAIFLAPETCGTSLAAAAAVP